MTRIPDNLPAGTTHFCPAFGRYPDRAMQLRRGDNWAYWTGFSWFEVQCGPPPSVRREMIDVREQAQWNGEGLPPVGLEVLTTHKGRDFKVRILAYAPKNGKQGVMVEETEPGNNFGCLFACLADRCAFRPIRTAEQIAAEEREQHRATTMAELNRLWDADTKRSDFLESVYRLMEGKQ